MKISIVSEGHMSSTLPLVRLFSQNGYDVDYFIVARTSKERFDAFPMETKCPYWGLNKLSKKNIKPLMDYFGNDRVNIYALHIFKPYSSIPLVRNIVKSVNKLILRSSCRYMNKKNYLFVNIVTRHSSAFMATFADYLKTRVIFSLHEVCNHLHPDFNKTPILLRKIILNKCDIVLHSKKSYDDILNYNDIDVSKLHIINFGLFETYKLVQPASIPGLPSRYALLFGVINEYKGLDIIFDVIKKCKKQLDDVKVVIAGKGYVPILDKIKQDDSFFVINRYISNEELVTLFDNAHIVLCPYKSASQSGLPQTSYVFGKPILSSDLDSFKEVIKDNKYGVTVSLTKIEEWSSLIINMFNNTTLCETIKKNIKDFSKDNPEYNWDYIYKEYLKIINK